MHQGVSRDVCAVLLPISLDTRQDLSYLPTCIIPWFVATVA